MEEFILKYWMEVGFTVITGFLVKRSRQDKKEREAMQLGVQALLRNELIESHDKYMKEGCCPIHNRDNIINMYDQYHKLGANGVVDGLMNELLRLPVEKC